MGSSKTSLAVMAGLAGLVFWKNASDDTKQNIFNFLSQIPAAKEEAERLRARAERQSQIPPLTTESLPELLDDRSIAEFLSELNQNVALANVAQQEQTIQIEPEPTESTINPETDRHKVVAHPFAVLILEKKGSGKSALAYRLLERFCQNSGRWVHLTPDPRPHMPVFIFAASALNAESLAKFRVEH